MNPVYVVMVLEFGQLACQIEGIPEEETIKVLAPNRPNEPLDKRMGNRDVRNRLDRVDFEYAQVREPSVKAKQQIMIGPQPTVRGVFGDPKTRVISLVRRLKTRSAAIVLECILAGTTGACGSSICPVATCASTWRSRFGTCSAEVALA